MRASDLESHRRLLIDAAPVEVGRIAANPEVDR